jgi:hypothetical protein
VTEIERTIQARIQRSTKLPGIPSQKENEPISIQVEEPTSGGNLNVPPEADLVRGSALRLSRNYSEALREIYQENGINQDVLFEAMFSFLRNTPEWEEVIKDAARRRDVRKIGGRIKSAITAMSNAREK